MWPALATARKKDNEQGERQAVQHADRSAGGGDAIRERCSGRELVQASFENQRMAVYD
jgi:hypothetical protein